MAHGKHGINTSQIIIPHDHLKYERLADCLILNFIELELVFGEKKEYFIF